MRRRQFITLVSSAAVAWPLAALAQQGGKKYTAARFGAGSATDPFNDVFNDAMTEALRKCRARSRGVMNR